MHSFSTFFILAFSDSLEFFQDIFVVRNGNHLIFDHCAKDFHRLVVIDDKKCGNISDAKIKLCNIWMVDAECAQFASALNKILFFFVSIFRMIVGCHHSMKFVFNFIFCFYISQFILFPSLWIFRKNKRKDKKSHILWFCSPFAFFICFVYYFVDPLHFHNVTIVT